MNKFIAFFFILLFFITGCNITGQSEEKPLYIGKNTIVDQTMADEAKQIVLSMDEVTSVKGATFQDDIFIAINVKQFDRFFLDEIRKKAHDKIKKRFPDTQVHVSTDKKVYLELEKLEQDIYHNKVEKAEIEKRWKKIEDYMKG